MKKCNILYIIITSTNAILHSDNRFYKAFITMPSCNYCTYKHIGNAKKRLNKIKSMYPTLNVRIGVI